MKGHTEPQLANSLWTRAPPQPSYSDRGWKKHASERAGIERATLQQQAGITKGPPNVPVRDRPTGKYKRTGNEVHPYGLHFLRRVEWRGRDVRTR